MPRDLAPGGRDHGGGAKSLGHRTPSSSVLSAYAFWRLCLIEANYKETENSNI